MDEILVGYHLDRRPWHEVLGVDAYLTDILDFDAINTILHERNRTRNYAEIISELRSVYAEVISRIKGMSFEELLEPRFADDQRNRPVLNWVIANTSNHFAEHRETIEEGSQRLD